MGGGTALLSLHLCEVIPEEATGTIYPGRVLARALTGRALTVGTVRVLEQS